MCACWNTLDRRDANRVIVQRITIPREIEKSRNDSGEESFFCTEARLKRWTIFGKLPREQRKRERGQTA